MSDRDELSQIIVSHDPDEMWRDPDNEFVFDQTRCPCGEVIGMRDGVSVITDPWGHLIDKIIEAGFSRTSVSPNEGNDR